jgi:DNA-binding transcriptional LysR family regulator
MDLIQLKCVLAVAKYRNFTRAAENTHISQSSLSQHISKIEHELGLQLFHRTTREVELLAPGVEFVKYAQKIIDSCEALKSMMGQYVELERSSISIGGIPIIRSYNIYVMITTFIRQNSNVTVEFIEAECFDLVQLLEKGKIDVALIHRLESHESIHYKDLFLDEFVIVINSSHPLAKHKTINLNEVSDESFILPSKDSASYQEFIRECKTTGFEPNILSKCGSVNTIIEFVRENLGIAILSYRVAEPYRDSSIALARINPSINRVVSLATLKNVQQPFAVKLFTEYSQRWDSEHPSYSSR